MLYTIYSNVPRLNIRPFNASIGKLSCKCRKAVYRLSVRSHQLYYNYKTLLTDRKEKEQVFPALKKSVKLSYPVHPLLDGLTPD